MDQSKKTMRHFYCRDVLWETFEQMANDFDCSIDYLINEAMRYYARSKNYQSASGGASGNAGSQPPPLGAPGGMPMPTAAANVTRRPPPPTQPPPSQRRPMPASQGYAGGGARHAAAPAYQAPAPPPLAPSPPMPVAPLAGTATLYLIYNNQRYPITKDQFIIGRGSKTSDLAIKDGNISRKHAAVIRRNGTFYIKDLGSTNGIDYKGMRIDNKRIDEGDIFHLCDYEIRFTYRPD
jgi:FHA domain